jgi:hypothetical protein
VFTTTAPLGSLARRSALTHLRVYRQEVAGRQHIVGIGMERGAFLELGGQATAVAVVDLHAKGAGAVGNGLADAAHAQDAEPLARHMHAHELGRSPAHPVVGSEHRHAFVRPPGGAQQAEQGDVGRGIGQYVGSVADGDVALGRGSDVDMLVADGKGGDDADGGGKGADRRGVECIACRAHDAVAAGRCRDQGGAVIEPVLQVQDSVEVGLQPGFDVRREMPGGQNPGFADGHGRYPPCAALPQAIILVFRAHGYYAWQPGYKA